jgi:hypothetical protein
MTQYKPPYNSGAAQSLRAAMGGYPAFDSLPKGFSDSGHIKDQINAADRAFLRAGMASDGTHCEEVMGFHPLMHDLSVGISFSGYYHYTSAGIVVMTTKTNSNIKEAKVQEVHGSNPIEVIKSKEIIPLWL